MEWVSYLAGEKWSDRPQCVCPVIAAFCRLWNDAMSDEDRQILVPLGRVVIGTRSTRAVEIKRSWMAYDWLVRVNLPAWLELAGNADAAALLKMLPEIVDYDTLKLAQSIINPLPKRYYWVAAVEAAGSALAAAAVVAAALTAAAVVAAAVAAVEAAAAVAAEEAAATKPLRPTVQVIQQSALDLVRRMCEVTK
jgi:hypothetical protein